MKKDIIKTLAQVNKWDNCNLCIEALQDIAESLTQGKNTKIQFTPDRNCSNLITHWHIEFIK